MTEKEDDEEDKEKSRNEDKKEETGLEDTEDNGDEMAPLVRVASKGHDTVSQVIQAAAVALENEQQPAEIKEDFGIKPEAPHPTRPPPPPTVNVQPYMDPQVIFRNVMIMEVSLHDKYAELRARRRKNALFLMVLVIWTSVFAVKQFFWRVESSAYRQVCFVCLLFGMAALGLFYLSGVYHNTLVYPRRFVSTSNKGLRQFNIKLTFASRYARWWWWPPNLTSFIRGCESIDDVLGGSIIKIVFLPRAFSNEFREAWDYYRDEFWALENDRRRRRRHLSTTTTTTTTAAAVNNNNTSSNRPKKTLRQHQNHPSKSSTKKKPPAPL